MPSRISMVWRLLDGRVWAGCAFVCFSLTSSGCNSASWSESTSDPESTPELAGFQLYSELGRACRAAVALSPTELYGDLSFIPCTTGEAGCEQLAWDGPLRWDPIGRGDMLEFSLQPGFASTGELRYILITHQYSTRTTEGIPFEAVAYEASTGKPVAAFRNMGDADLDDGSEVILGPARNCLLSVGISSDTAVVLARPSGSNQIVLNRAPLALASSIKTFAPVEADDSVFRGRIFGSGKTAAFEQTDGKLFTVDTTTGRVEQGYGPALRLWLSGISGDDVLARSANPSADGYYWFRGANSFERIAMSVTHLLADATRVAWLQDTGGALNVHIAARSALDAASSAPVFAALPHATVLGMTLGEGVLAVHSATSALSTANSDLYLIDLESGVVRHRTLAASGSKVRLLANSRDQAFLGQSDYLGKDDTQFGALVRYTLQ